MLGALPAVSDFAQQIPQVNLVPEESTEIRLRQPFHFPVPLRPELPLFVQRPGTLEMPLSSCFCVPSPPLPCETLRFGRSGNDVSLVNTPSPGLEIFVVLPKFFFAWQSLLDWQS